MRTLGVKLLGVAILLAISPSSQAAEIHATIHMAQGKVTYGYKAFLEPGDPSYTKVTVEHTGRRDSTYQHTLHIETRNVFPYPQISVHSLPSATYNLRVGTHDYCSEVGIDSHFWGGGVTPQYLNANDETCMTYCYDREGSEGF